MATRMDNTTERPDMTDSRPKGPKVWPWVLLALAVVVVLWWAAMNSSNRFSTSYNTPSNMSAPMPSAGTGTGGTSRTGK